MSLNFAVFCVDPGAGGRACVCCCIWWLELMMNNEKGWICCGCFAPWHHIWPLSISLLATLANISVLFHSLAFLSACFSTGSCYLICVCVCIYTVYKQPRIRVRKLRQIIECVYLCLRLPLACRWWRRKISKLLKIFCKWLWLVCQVEVTRHRTRKRANNRCEVKGRNEVDTWKEVTHPRTKGLKCFRLILQFTKSIRGTANAFFWILNTGLPLSRDVEWCGVPGSWAYCKWPHHLFIPNSSGFLFFFPHSEFFF